MAEAAACTILPSLHGNGSSAPVDYGSVSNIFLPAATGKRKTPLELRLEQLKRVRTVHDEEIPPAGSSDGYPLPSKSSGPRKHEISKPPRFVDTRVADIYAATKPGDRPKFFVKDKQKDAPLFPQKNKDQPSDLGVATAAIHTKPLAEFQWKEAGDPVHADLAVESKSSSMESKNTSLGQKTNSVSFSTFRNVTQISSGLSEPSSGPILDMVKALKGMAASKALNVVDQTVGAGVPTRNLNLSPVSNINVQDKSPSLWIQGDKIPLDLSLKTSMRLISPVSFQWCQRVSNRNQCAGLQSFISPLGSHENNDRKTNACRLDVNSNPNNIEASYWKALHSWVHPQSVLPPSVLSALASCAARGGAAESAFLSKRQQLWEESFRSLYYMFRNRLCDLFYFSTQQFIVMFIGGGFGGRSKDACSAYLTRSTRGLRGLFQEQDIVFSMPLCTTEVGTTTVEEIQELTEFEKANPGQTRLVDSMIAVDNSSQSLLAFDGHKSVHGLYDFLLNHRFLLSSTTGADVPVLYSPVSFQNAAVVVPEVSCKQMQCAGDIFKIQEHGETAPTLANETSLNMSFSLEVKGTLLPPWVVCRICSAIEQSRPGSFEASLVTDLLSGGLNISQEVAQDPDSQLADRVNESAFSELKKLTVSAGLRTGFVKHLKFASGSYLATLATV